MGEGYNTGDDTATEAIVMVMIVSILITSPAYLAAVPLPEAWTVVLTVLAGCVAFYISGGRVFWVVLCGVFWVLLKLKIVKPDKTEYTIECDETGWPVKLVKKEEEIKEKPEELK